MTNLTPFPSRLTLPLIAAPMFRVSSPDLVIAACKSGVIGSFPTANCRTIDDLSFWLASIQAALTKEDAPFCPNLIMQRENLHNELACLIEHNPEIVITSVGSPAPVIPSLHRINCLVFADVATIYHAKKAINAGADGLILLCAGAGGQTGWANSFAFVRAVRDFYDGPLVLAGGLADGYALWAAKALGCTWGYMGTRFIATEESLANQPYKNMLVDSSMDDILLTKAFTGLDTNFIKTSIINAGLDPSNLPSDISKEGATALYGKEGIAGPRRWKDIWSAGHSVSGVKSILSVSELIKEITKEYKTAQKQLLSSL